MILLMVFGPGTIPIGSGSKFHAKRIYQNHLTSHMKPNSLKTDFLAKTTIGNFLSNKMSSQKIAFPNPFQAKDAQGGASNFQKGDLHMDFSEALSPYGKTPRILVFSKDI